MVAAFNAPNWCLLQATSFLMAYLIAITGSLPHGPLRQFRSAVETYGQANVASGKRPIPISTLGRPRKAGSYAGVRMRNFRTTAGERTFWPERQRHYNASCIN